MSISTSQNREDELIEVAQEMLAAPSTTRISIPMTLLPMTPEEVLAIAKVIKAAREVYDQHFLKRVNVGRGSFEHAYNDLRDALAGLEKKQL